MRASFSMGRSCAIRTAASVCLAVCAFGFILWESTLPVLVANANSLRGGNPAYCHRKADGWCQECHDYLGPMLEEMSYKCEHQGEANDRCLKSEHQSCFECAFTEYQTTCNGQRETHKGFKCKDQNPDIAANCARKLLAVSEMEHINELSQTAATAISNIKFDKVIVWENGGANGNGSTANFLQNMAKTLPPMLQIMEDICGVKMPEYFGQMSKEEKSAEANGAAAPAESQA